jgi:hypothetical protein
MTQNADSRTLIRATHPYGFRSGEWAVLVAVVPTEARDCYLVEFPDGVTDFWPVHDPSDPYEFDGVPPNDSGET